jgi:predicted MFS family arabinose efflux permease
MGLARTIFNLAIQASFPSVVGEGDLTRANALIGGTFSVSETAGPALGGLLVATVGVEAAFVIDAATCLISAALLSLIPLPRPQEGGRRRWFRGRLVVGVRLPGPLARAPRHSPRGLPHRADDQHHDPG